MNSIIQTIHNSHKPTKQPQPPDAIFPLPITNDRWRSPSDGALNSRQFQKKWITDRLLAKRTSLELRKGISGFTILRGIVIQITGLFREWYSLIKLLT